MLFGVPTRKQCVLLVFSTRPRLSLSVSLGFQQFLTFPCIFYCVFHAFPARYSISTCFGCFSLQITPWSQNTPKHLRNLIWWSIHLHGNLQPGGTQSRATDLALEQEFACMKAYIWEAYNLGPRILDLAIHLIVQRHTI